jgi:hypothetical protein
LKRSFSKPASMQGSFHDVASQAGLCIIFSIFSYTGT